MKTKIILLLSAVLFFSCEKGEKGEPGTNGNANVHTQIFNVASSNWNLTGSVWKCTLTDSDITAAIAATGSVDVLIESSIIAGTYEHLPVLVPFAFGTDFTMFNYSYTTGQVTVSYLYSDNSAPPNPGTRQFKVVAIAEQ